MVAGQFIEYLSKFQVGNFVGVEDFADKFNFLFTVILFLLCTSIVTVKQYILKPISCYLSIDLGGFNLLEYVENYCWVEGTVPISPTANFPANIHEWNELNRHKILYYQWVPFVLGIQGIMFHLPRLCWQMYCYNYTGTDLSHLVTSANQAVHSNEEARQKMVNFISKTIEQTLYQHRDIRSGKWARIRRSFHQFCSYFIMSKRQGTRLFIAYLIIKFLYLINAIGQLFLMRHFLSPKTSNSILFGFEVMKNITKGSDWKSTLVFPRVGFCFVPIRSPGSVNFATAQCVLPVNMLNEKIYFFIWCWIFTDCLLLSISIIIWFFRMSFWHRKRGFIHRFLKLNQQIRNSNEEQVMISKFEKQFLRNDGVFLLKMISINSGDMITSDIVCNLWKTFKMHYANRNFLNDGPDAEENTNRTLIKLESSDNIKSGTKGSLNNINNKSRLTSQPSAPLMRTISEDNSAIKKCNSALS